MCCIRYQTCADTNSFTLDTIAPATDMGTVDTLCSDDYILIENSTPVIGQRHNHNRYCGDILVPADAWTVDNPVYCEYNMPLVT